MNLVSYYTDDVNYYIFCGNTDLGGEPLTNVSCEAWTKFNEHTFVWYAGTDKRSQTLLAECEKIKPEIIFSVGLFSWHFNIVPILFCKAPKKFLSVRGMLHEGALSQKRFKKQLYLKTLGFFGFHRKVIFHATNENEKLFIEKQFGEEVKTMIASNIPRIFNRKEIYKESGSLRICSVGIISPMKNYLLVLKALQSSNALIHYEICGAVKDPVYWVECQNLINTLPSNVTVTYHGEVMPVNIEEILTGNHIFILPSKSENFGHAIFEALSAGRPAITSETTPWNNLESFYAGINVELTAIKLKTAIDFFAAMNNDTYQSWSTAASTYASNALDLEQIKLQYDAIFK